MNTQPPAINLSASNKPTSNPRGSAQKSPKKTVFDLDEGFEFAETKSQSALKEIFLQKSRKIGLLIEDLKMSEEYKEIVEVMDSDFKKFAKTKFDSVILESFDQICELCGIRINVITVDSFDSSMKIMPLGTTERDNIRMFIC